MPTATNIDYVDINGLNHFKDKLETDYALTNPASKQDKITATGITNVLTAPDEEGGQPGSVPIASLHGQEFIVTPNYAAATTLGTLTLPATGAINTDFGSNVLTVVNNGYVLLSGRTAYTSGNVSRGMIVINNRMVWSSDIDGASGWVDYGHGPFPVSAGDTVMIRQWCTAASPPWNSRAVQCLFIPPKTVAMQTSSTLANSLTTMGPPDYASLMVVADIETSITNGLLLWTADADCYVDVIVTASGEPGSIYISVQPPNQPTIAVFVAGEKAAGDRSAYQLKVVKGTNLYTGPNSDTRITRIILHKCVPVITPPLYVSGDVLVNYSTEEQDTRVKDTDGKNIWQKTFTGNITAAVDTTVYTLLTTSVKSLISVEGWVQTGDDANIKPLQFIMPGYAVAFVYQHNDGVHISSNTSTARDGVTNSAYRVTIRYTKT